MNDAFVRGFNLGEAVLWGVLALLTLFWRAPDRFAGTHWRRFLPVGFLIFGVTDLIERETGAWWRPWWLLMLKTACVAFLFFTWRRWRIGSGTR